MSASRPLSAYADVGRALAERREERGVTLEFAAHALHVPKDLIAALEAGAPGAFDATIYYLGHLRRYATWLEMDPGALIRRLPDHGSREPAGPPPPDAGDGWPSSPRAWLGATAGLLFVGAILAALWFFLGTRPMRHPQHPHPALAVSQPARVSAPPSLPLRPPRAARVPRLRLRFVLKHSSWIAVTARGKTVYAKLVKPGIPLRLKAGPPIKVVLGNAPEVALFVDGKRLSLVPWTGADHVAVLRLAAPQGSSRP